MDQTAPQSVETESFIQSSFSESWSAFTKDAVLFILASLVALVISVVSLGILLGPMTVGLIDVVRKRRRGEVAKVGDVFGGFSSFGASFVAMLLIGLGIVIGLVLLVLPGLVFMFLCAFAFNEIAYRGVGAVDAITGSFQIVKSNFVPVAIVMVAVLAINFVGGMVPFGTLLTSPFCTVLMVVAYEKLTGQSP